MRSLADHLSPACQCASHPPLDCGKGYCRQNTNLALGRWAVDVAQHQGKHNYSELRAAGPSILKGFGIYLATLAGHDLAP